MNKSIFVIIIGLLLINTFLFAQQNDTEVECDEWEAISSAACQPTSTCGTTTYQVLLVIVGPLPDSLLLINNLTEDTTGFNTDTLVNLVYQSEEFLIKTGFDFTILDANNPSCSKNLSEGSVDCVIGSAAYFDAKEDEGITEINTPLIIDVLHNDLEAACVSDVTPFSQSGGTLEINEDCTITYTPPTGFSGVDNFTYTAITNFEKISSAEVKVLVVEGELDSLYVQEEIICYGYISSGEPIFTANFYFPFFNSNYYWRFCGDSDWQSLDSISGPDTPLSLDFDLYTNEHEYCLEFVDFDHPDDIIVKEKYDIDCFYSYCCFENFDVFYELDCNSDPDSVSVIFTLEQVAATQTYQWRNCWSDTWNEISVPESQNISEPFVLKIVNASDICIEFRNVRCSDHYFAIWQENIDCTTTSIDLFSINGKAENNYNKINWTTASETNNKYYILERSVDGQHFTPLIEKSGRGSSNTTQTYFYNDFDVEERSYYYRLSTVDFDGKREWIGEVIFIEREAKPIRLSLFPNPTSQFIKVLFPSSTKEKINWQVSDIYGKKVKEGFTEVGMSHLKIKVEDLPNGTYFLKIGESWEQEHLLERFIVIR